MTRKKNWSLVPDGGLIPGQTSRLTVGHKITLTWTEVGINLCGYRDVAWPAQQAPTAVRLSFLDRSRYFFHSSSSLIWTGDEL
jgi:hypothetical protein